MPTIVYMVMSHPSQHSYKKRPDSLYLSNTQIFFKGNTLTLKSIQLYTLAVPSFYIALYVSKLSFVFLIVAEVAEHVQDPPAHVDLLPPARLLLQPPQLHACSSEVPSSGCAEVAPQVRADKTLTNTENLSDRLQEVCAEFWNTVREYESDSASDSNPSGMPPLGSLVLSKDEKY